MILEVCTGSVTDALKAKACGANRIELCSALELGGLTPSLGTVRNIAKTCDLPIIAMIRPRPGDFCYDNADFRVMVDDVEILRDAGVSGYAFGILTEEGEIDIGRCFTLIEHMEPLEAVFHRAFDLVPDPESALEQLIEMGVKRVLTSGQAANAPEGAGRIDQLVQQANHRIEILPGAGIRPDNLEELIRTTGCQQAHGTFSKRIQKPDGVQDNRSLPGENHALLSGEIDQEAVSRARQILDSMA